MHRSLTEPFMGNYLRTLLWRRLDKVSFNSHNLTRFILVFIRYLGNHSYVTAVMGKGKLDLPVKGPHEQIAQVIRAVTIQKDVLLLKVDKEIKLNRYVQIADLNSRWEGDSREKCFAAGVGEKGVEFKALYPKTKCPRGYRCFDRKITEDCVVRLKVFPASPFI